MAASDGAQGTWIPSLARSRPPVLEFPVNPRRASKGVGLGHPSDERSDLRGDDRAAWFVPAALPGPEELEAGPLPSNHGGGLDDGDGSHPATPQVGQQDPEQAVAGPEPRTRRGALEDGQLVPQGEVLEHQGLAGPSPVGACVGALNPPLAGSGRSQGRPRWVPVVSEAHDQGPQPVPRYLDLLNGRDRASLWAY